MIKRSFVILLSLLFLSGCGSLLKSTGIKVSDDSAQVIEDVVISTIGYKIGQHNQDKALKWIEWADKILEIEAGTSVITYEDLLAEAFKVIIDDPYLALQFGKLIKILEFPELQPPELDGLTEDYVIYVKRIITDFRDGLEAAKELKG